MKIFLAVWNSVAKWQARKLLPFWGIANVALSRGGVCDHVEMGNLIARLSKIQPAVYDEKTEVECRNASNGDFVEKVAAINVKKTVHAILERSPILKEMIETGQIGIVGGMHDIATGSVNFYKDVTIIKPPALKPAG